jgi:hypothetical protein
MNRALETFAHDLHVRRHENAEGLEDALRELDECADEYDVAQEFIDTVTWIAQQPVSIWEKCRVLGAVADLSDDQDFDLTCAAARIELSVVA